MNRSAAMKMLAKQLEEFEEEPVEGILVRADESNIFNWEAWIEGPSDTYYAGGVFKLHMQFPEDFPLSPPKVTIVSDFWHPNVYKDGVVCISILHPPGPDEMSGEDESERWLPTRSLASILLSVISILSAPNFSSPANIDASVEMRNKPKEFAARVKKLVEKSLREKPADVKIPHPDTDPKERALQVEKMKRKNALIDGFDDDIGGFDDDDDDGFDDGFDDETLDRLQMANQKVEIRDRHGCELKNGIKRVSKVGLNYSNVRNLH